MNDTGESNASLDKRSNEQAWPVVKKELEGGAVLRRPKNLNTYYPYINGDFCGTAITKSFVLKLQRKGVLSLAGVENYILKPANGITDWKGAFEELSRSYKEECLDNSEDSHEDMETPEAVISRIIKKYTNQTPPKTKCESLKK